MGSGPPQDAQIGERKLREPGNGHQRDTGMEDPITGSCDKVSLDKVNDGPIQNILKIPRTKVPELQHFLDGKTSQLVEDLSLTERGQ